MLNAVARTLRPVLGPVVRQRNRRALRRFASSCPEAERLKSAHYEAIRITKNRRSDLLDAIERERDRLSGLQDPLVDGTLESFAPWDGDRTIANACEASRTPLHAGYLYGLIRTLRPLKVLELGTNLGMSGSYMAAALKENGDGGRLVTMDGSAYRQRIARGVMENVGLDNVEFVMGNFDDTFDPMIESQGAFDLAFIDGNHERDPTLHYADAVCKKAEGDACLIFDDIRWSPGMIEAWDAVKDDPRLVAGIDLSNLSICLMRQGALGPPIVSPSLRGEFT